MNASPVLARAQLRLQKGEDALNLQIWFWGQDVLFSKGNLLLKYGFRKTRPPKTLGTSSAYSLIPAAQRRLTLWAWGVYYAWPSMGGVFLRRYGFEPQFTPVTEWTSDAWAPEEIPQLKTPSTNMEHVLTKLLWVETLQWIEKYERWIQKTIGTDHRVRCHRDWTSRTKKMKTTIDPCQMPQLWKEVIEEFSK